MYDIVKMLLYQVILDYLICRLKLILSGYKVI